MCTLANDPTLPIQVAANHGVCSSLISPMRAYMNAGEHILHGQQLKPGCAVKNEDVQVAETDGVVRPDEVCPTWERWQWRARAVRPKEQMSWKVLHPPPEPVPSRCLVPSTFGVPS